MVSPSTTLHDLRRGEGAIRVTCPACKAVKQHDPEELIIDRRFRRLSMKWEAVQHTVPCRECDSTDARVDGVPFGQDYFERRARRSQAPMMNLALAVLDDASRRAEKEDVCVPAARLALHVL
jgi:phage FluMu protein Com